MPSHFSRRLFHRILGLTAVGLLAGPAWAQAWPTKPVKIILPFAAGGGGDTVMRPIAQKLGEALGQQVVLENLPGAGGALGMRAAIKSPTDGHTFVMISNTHAIIETLKTNLGYSTLKDFVPVTAMASLPLVLVVNPNLPFKTTQELLAHDKANPGKPGLKAPQPEGGPRKDSFCARMGGMPGPMKKPNGEPTRKALSLSKWKC